MDRKRILSSVLLALFVAAIGARTWLARQQRADEERRMRALVLASSRINNEVAEREQKRLAEAQRAELRKSIADLEEQGRRIHVPPPLVLSATPPDGGSARPAPRDEHLDAFEMPHHFVISAIDVSRLAMDQAPAADFRDRAAKKALVAALGEIQDTLRKALGPGDEARFPDPAAVAALLPRVEELLARADATLKPGVHRDQALRNLRDFRDDLRDFDAAVKQGKTAPARAP